MQCVKRELGANVRRTIEIMLSSRIFHQSFTVVEEYTCSAENYRKILLFSKMICDYCLTEIVATFFEAELQRGEQGDSMIILDSVCRLLRSANQDVYLEHLAELLNEVSTSDLMDPKKYGILEEYIKYNFHSKLFILTRI